MENVLVLSEDAYGVLMYCDVPSSPTETLPVKGPGAFKDGRARKSRWHWTPNEPILVAKGVGAG